MQCVYLNINRRRLPVATGTTATAIRTKRRAAARRKRRERAARRFRIGLVLMLLLAVIIWTMTGMLVVKTDVAAAEPDAMTGAVKAACSIESAGQTEPETPAPEKPWTQYEAEELAKAIWGEARGCKPSHQAAVAWCALNRVGVRPWGDDLISVLSQPSQFCGYDPEYPVDPDILAIAEDVLARYWSEQLTGTTDPGRVLPADYYYFTGDGYLNWFRTDFEDTGDYWDWSLPSPYGD